MQFIKHGPDIPERLLRAHEDGRVVFFCGAGVSSAAGLPDFKGLALKLFEAMGVTPSPVQRAALKAGQYDTAVGLLETAVAPGRVGVRSALASVLTPDPARIHAIDTHEAILSLSTQRNGRIRLVTTNFDRLFTVAIEKRGRKVDEVSAPLLPVPNNSWDGVVYLHGRLTELCTPKDLDCLVLSSGDFGRAYLTQRWAARFVSELFRAHTVCFVGYGVNDPVMRYMLDALAADRLLGESPPEAFAFGMFSRGQKKDREEEWGAKNVTPILYAAHRRHSRLHQTLREWARTYSDGVRGKERVIVESALARPSGSTQEDDFVGRVLWALSDPSGAPARKFAVMDPVPSLEWLEPLSIDRYLHGDLERFGIQPRAAIDDELKFSLTARPSPYKFAPWMRLVGSQRESTRWDDPMHGLAHWLLRHLDDPELLLWLVRGGGALHPRFRDLVAWRLREIADLERNDPSGELARIVAFAPRAVPRLGMRVLWKLFLTGRVKPRGERDSEMYRWVGRVAARGLTSTDRLELRDILRPMIAVRKKMQWPGESDEVIRSQAGDFVDCELVLAADHVHYALKQVPKDANWEVTLAELVPDLNQLLRDAMGLLEELGLSDVRSDRSYVQQPSISAHSQNRDFNDWTALIELLRDGWLVLAREDPTRASRIAEDWWQEPYPVFKRLALFAAVQEGVVAEESAVEWLLTNGSEWLWSDETQREVCRLLVALSPRLSPVLLGRVMRAVLAGPSRALFRADIEAELLEQIVMRDIWLRLKKIQQSEVELPADASARLEDIEQAFVEHRLDANEREEFPFWIGSGSQGQGPPGVDRMEMPERRPALVEYLRATPRPGEQFEEHWRDLCTKRFHTAAATLMELALAGEWPIGAWRGAFYAWHEPLLAKRSWRYLASCLAREGTPVLELLPALSNWLQVASKETQLHEVVLLAICDQIFEAAEDGEAVGDDPVFTAINRPVGHATRALLNVWFSKPLSDGQGLDEPWRSRFQVLCQTTRPELGHGRVLLAANVIALFRIDEAWTRQQVLPLFDWEISANEAKAAWQGFLWSPRLYRPLFAALKRSFLESASRYELLGEFQEQYAALLTFAALDRGDAFTYQELRNATGMLPPEGITFVARALVRALEGAEEDKQAYWEGRILPYVKNVWPKSKELVTPEVAANFAQLCTSTGGGFPAAVHELRPWLRPLAHPSQCVNRLHREKLCLRFPQEALEFLDTVVGMTVDWVPEELRECLEAIDSAADGLKTDPRFIRLIELVNR
ncbi:MAG: hypothetical protein JW395_2496 [Nitrospira sp.]|nr:hypothetical protein [Nitrospira sp.]